MRDGDKAFCGSLVLDLSIWWRHVRARTLFSSISFSECNEAALFVVTHHGGHLGFYEGGFFTVSPLTWLDKAVMQYIMAVLKVKQSVEKSSLLNGDKKCAVAS